MKPSFRILTGGSLVLGTLLFALQLPAQDGGRMRSPTPAASVSPEATRVASPPSSSLYLSTAKAVDQVCDATSEALRLLHRLGADETFATNLHAAATRGSDAVDAFLRQSGFHSSSCTLESSSTERTRGEIKIVVRVLNVTITIII